jgi:hypothetical protein
MPRESSSEYASHDLAQDPDPEQAAQSLSDLLKELPKEISKR